jgi:prepilin-type N-terminal cleavage/methylation domain-containing protein
MNKKAFTLIEMLVVILIIMILAGYAIFAYLDSLYEAEFNQGKAKLELINAGYERFALEYPTAACSLERNKAFEFTAGTGLNCQRSSNISPDTLIHCGYLPKTEFKNDKKFQYFLEPDTRCDASTNGGNAARKCVGNGYAYMQAKSDAKLGKYAGKCAGISLLEGGKAVQ